MLYWDNLELHPYDWYLVFVYIKAAVFGNIQQSSSLGFGAKLIYSILCPSTLTFNLWWVFSSTGWRCFWKLVMFLCNWWCEGRLESFEGKMQPWTNIRTFSLKKRLFRTVIIHLSACWFLFSARLPTPHMASAHSYIKKILFSLCCVLCCIVLL